MIGDPAQFEALGNRLGFRVVETTQDRFNLIWQGARFPAFLCLGIALLLLFVSVPIVQALLMRGFVGPAGSLWYFPLMNLVLFGIAIFLISQRRSIEIDSTTSQVTLKRVSLYHATMLQLNFEEVSRVTLGNDQVADSFAVGGSTAARSFPIPALRLRLVSGQTVLLDRGSLRRLTVYAKDVSKRIGKPLQVDPELETTASYDRRKIGAN